MPNCFFFFFAYLQINCLRAGDALNFTCKLPGFIPSGSEVSIALIIVGCRITLFILDKSGDSYLEVNCIHCRQ